MNMMSRYLYFKRVGIALIVIIIIFIVIIVFKCKLSDEKAIEIARTTCSVLNLNDNGSYRVKSANILRQFLFGIKYKNVFINNGNDEISVLIGCKDIDIVGIYNTGLYNRYLQSNTIKVNDNEVVRWKAIISNIDATNDMMSIANKLRIKEDMKLSSIALDKYKGVWSGRWQRILNGIEVEDDYIIINIMAVNGDFYSYSKHINGYTCSTIAKLTKEDAFKIAELTFKKEFTDFEWKNNSDKFEVKSCSLKVISSKLGVKNIFNIDNICKLAWVVTISTKDIVGNKTVGIVNKDSSIIYIDAENGNIISTDINIGH